MDENILLGRMKEFVDEYGDIFLAGETDNSVMVKDGKGNMFEIKITKMS